MQTYHVSSIVRVGLLDHPQFDSIHVSLSFKQFWGEFCHERDGGYCSCGLTGCGVAKKPLPQFLPIYLWRHVANSIGIWKSILFVKNWLIIILFANSCLWSLDYRRMNIISCCCCQLSSDLFPLQILVKTLLSYEYKIVMLVEECQDYNLSFEMKVSTCGSF